MFSLPNLLTLSRIVVIPLLIATFFVPAEWARWTACGLFVAAAVTDFFDGWLARRWNQVSAFGRFLDPIADKLIVASAILMLAGFGWISTVSLIPAVVIMCREILVSGLREFLAELQVGMPVSKLAKWKTTIQLIALSVLLVGDAGPGILGHAWALLDITWLRLIGEVLLWAAGVLTAMTGWDYLKKGLHHMRAHDDAQALAKTGAQATAQADTKADTTADTKTGTKTGTKRNSTDAVAE